jgi:hypothetical protein
MEFVRTAIAAYVIMTLTATALAKFKNWQTASVSVTREGIIPSRAALAVIIAVSSAEFLLATFFAFGFQPQITGFAAAGLFVLFLGYQLLVAKRTNSLMCSCAGAARTDPVSLPAVAGTTLSCLVQAALSSSLAIVRPATGVLQLVVIVAWIIPIVLFVIGLSRRIERPRESHRVPLWSPYHNYDIRELNDQAPLPVDRAKVP